MQRVGVGAAIPCRVAAFFRAVSAGFTALP